MFSLSGACFDASKCCCLFLGFYPAFFFFPSRYLARGGRFFLSFPGFIFFTNFFFSGYQHPTPLEKARREDNMAEISVENVECR